MMSARPAHRGQRFRFRKPMHEILQTLSPTAVVLDLGCAAGSFDLRGCPFTAIRLDIDSKPGVANFVQADAAHLPFRAAAFDAVISNHSLEHLPDLSRSLVEIGRVTKSDGALYIGVPDAATLTDKLYRWLARGGGHVNGFRSAPQLAAEVSRVTGLPCVATRTLCTSFSFLHRGNRRTRGPRRLWLLGGGTGPSLLLATYLLRLLDRLFHTRLSVYGWAFYFGKLAAPVDLRVRTNVCIRCGSGHSSDALRKSGGVVKMFPLPRWYRCPNCRTVNLFTEDADYGRFL